MLGNALERFVERIPISDSRDVVVMPG